MYKTIKLSLLLLLTSLTIFGQKIDVGLEGGTRVLQINDEITNMKAGLHTGVTILVSQNDTTYAAGPQFFGSLTVSYTSNHEYGNVTHRFLNSRVVLGISDTKNFYGGISLGYMDNFEINSKNTITIGLELLVKSNPILFNRVSIYTRGSLGTYTNNIYEQFITDNAMYLEGSIGLSFNIQ